MNAAANVLDCIEIVNAPHATPAPSRAVIWLHGLGASGDDFVPVVPELGWDDSAQPIRFIFPHAPVQPVTVNGGVPMRAWYDIVSADLARREDAAGIRASEAHLRALIARENARGVATEHIVLAGFSQGCAMALHTGVRYPQRLGGLIGLSGYLPLADTVAAERNPANHATPIFLAHGTIDPVVPLVRAQQARDQLQALGYPVHWHTYPMAHSVCAPQIAAIGAFLRRVL